MAKWKRFKIIFVSFLLILENYVVSSCATIGTVCIGGEPFVSFVYFELLAINLAVLSIFVKNIINFLIGNFVHPGQHFVVHKAEFLIQYFCVYKLLNTTFNHSFFKHTFPQWLNSRTPKLAPWAGSFSTSSLPW